MKTKKLLSILLSILMLTGVFAVNASAADELSETDVILAGTIVSGTEESYWLTVDGALTADGASASNYNISITPATETSATKVTLKNAQLSKISLLNELYYYAFGSSSTLDIEIQGTNKIDIYPEAMGYACGIMSGEALKIYGSGSLVMNIGNNNAAIAQGLSGNTVDISGNTAITLNLNSFYEINGGYSLYATTLSDNANLEINETMLNVTIPDLELDREGVNATGYKITYEGLKLSDNAKISVKTLNPDSVINTNYGFNINGNLELSGNSHLSSVGTDAAESMGICMNNGSITVSGTSTITAKAGNASETKSYGILCYNGNGNKLNVTVSDSAKIIATAGNTVGESGGICAHAVLTATDNAYISGTAGNSSSSESAGAWFWYGASLSGNAQVKGISGDAETESYGVYVGDNSSITASDNAVIDGYAGKASAESCGIKAGEGISANGKAKLTGESKGSTEEESAGIFAEEDFKAYGNTEINAKGGDGFGSAGIYADDTTVYGSAKINAAAGTAIQTSAGLCSEGNLLITENASVTAEGGKAPKSIGIAALRNSTISGNAQITAKACSANQSYGFFGSDNTAYSLTVTDNAVITAESAQGTEHSVALFVPTKITISENAKITATADESEKYSFGIACTDAIIRNAATVEATGNHSALYMQDSYEITGYADAYIEVSTDTNPENAVEYDNSDILAAYETEEALHNSPYKYVLIAPEAPEEPESELSFFEQLLADIASFFNSIIEFFTSLFSLVG